MKFSFLWVISLNLKWGGYLVSIDFVYNEYEFKNVEEDDLDGLVKWIRENNDEDSTCYSLDSQIFYRRFLEYYVTENECFIKIEKDRELVGVFKGRLELDNKKELFIWFYIVNKELRNRGLGSEFIERIIKYFEDGYSVNIIKVGIVEDNEIAFNFWKGRGFDMLRTVENFFENDRLEEKNLSILKR